MELKKSLGQNFLTDIQTAEDMVKGLDLKENDYVVEIGPGQGFVTEVLVEELEKVNGGAILVELDSRFIKNLNEEFGKKDFVEVVEANILDWLPNFKKERFKIIGSIPYNITSPILHKIVKHESSIDTCVLLIQKEVAEKIVDLAPKGSYLSNFIQTFFDVEILKIVSKENFKPQPRVDSSILKMTRKEKTLIQKEEAHKFEGFLHKGFSKPRKMLNKVFSIETLKLTGIDEKLRPQHLAIEQWINLYRNLVTTSLKSK